jgi:hypothetical protein
LLELALVLGGAFLYHRRATQLPADALLSNREQRRRALTASAVVTGLMLSTLVLNVLGF